MRGRRVPDWLQWLFRIVFTVGVTWIIARQVGVGLDDALALDRGVPELRPVPMGASILVLLLAFGFAARLWGWMVRELGGRDPGALASARIILTANLGRYIPGKVWQLAGVAVLSRRAGIAASTGTLSALLVQGFALTATAAWGIPVLADNELRIALAVAAALLILASIPPVTRTGFRVLFRLARRDPDESPRTGPGFGPRWLAWHGILWGVYGLAFHWFMVGLGFDIGFGTAAVSFAAAYLLGYLALPAPAGIGVREGVLLALLQPHIGAAAAPVAILARLWMTVVELVPAGILAGWEALRRPGEEE
jgi:glycosyltransferase 2 family protein